MKTIFWILSGLTALIIVFTVCLLLRVNLIFLFELIGMNPFSFFIGLMAGIGLGYFLFRKDNRPGSTQDP